ncbi:MAG TPA: tetratricopeptide repeat protein [Bacteroidales bacterium]|nr:tetratricopeptide repeat protein [Bacteroidales bacterium]
MKNLKIVFAVLAGLLLVLMILMSRDAGVNCDEVLHYNHSLSVLRFYSTHGSDTAVLNTPVTHLKYYGQSFDNLTTLFTSLAGTDDVYGFRHFMSSLAGWLAILVTAFFAIWLEGYGAGIIVLLLFLISNTFLGHSQNNLKDIPFALAYISGIWFTLRVLSSRNKIHALDILLLVASMAFCISIRPGGLVLICYCLLFYVVYYCRLVFTEGSVVIKEALGKGLLFLFVSGASFFCGIIFWPFALLNPLKNVLESYRVMVHFPDTFRQIFEGRAEYSDFMPWYYLVKSMAITIPLLVLAGLLLYLVFCRKAARKGNFIFHLFILFSIIFPLILVIAARSNLYSSWRHFLFVYPGIVLLSAAGLSYLIRSVRSKIFLAGIFTIVLVLMVHPLLYLVNNHRYAYIYYNELTGGLKGAYGKYETDYYFVSQRESAEWLLRYLKENRIRDSVTVASNFSAGWFFRKEPRIRNRYVRFGERNTQKWDYAIITSRYIPVYQLVNGIWPNGDVLHIVYADSVPISVVLKKSNDSGWLGYGALQNGRTDYAIDCFSKAVKADSTDDMIFYNFAVALFRKGMMQKADSVLKICLKLNPESDLALMFLGDMSVSNGRFDDARNYYRRVITINRKYPDAYLSLARLYDKNDVMTEREILRECIEVNPNCSEAVSMLGDTYSKKDPDIAKKYYEMAKTIK